MYVKHTPLLSEQHECIVTQCIGCGIAVHRELGPGFKERIYHTAYCLELDRCGLKFESEKRIEVKYRDWFIPGQRIDLVVEGVVLVEIKATPKVRALHKSQVVSQDHGVEGPAVDELQLGALQGRPPPDRCIGTRLIV